MEDKIHKIASEIRKKIHYNCKCNECERLRDLLDYLVGIENRLDSFLEIYEKYKVSDTCSIQSDNVKDFLKEIMSYYVEIKKDKFMEVEQQKKEVRNFSQA